MYHYWKLLGIEPTDDAKQVKRAYAARLKLTKPDENPAGFQELREAYEWVLQYGLAWVRRQTEHEDDEYLDHEVEDHADANPAKADDYIDQRENQGALPTIADPPAVPNLPAAQAASDVPTVQAASDVHVAPLQYAVDLAPLHFNLPSIAADQPQGFDRPSSPPPLPKVEDELPNYGELPPIVQLNQTQNPQAKVQVEEPPLPPAIALAPPPLVSLAAVDVRAAKAVEMAPIKLRRLEVFLQALWDQSQRAASVDAMKWWLTAQAEFESLQLRDALDQALQETFAENAWPWPTVIAVAELLEWGTVGNRLDYDTERAVGVARKQASMATLAKPRFWQWLSPAGLTYYLRQPFSWLWFLVLHLFPTRVKIDQLFIDCAAHDIAPPALFDHQQIMAQVALRQVGFNRFKTAVNVWRALFWPIIIGLSIGLVDRTVPIAPVLVWIVIFLAIWLIGTCCYWLNAVIWQQYQDRLQLAAKHPPALYIMLVSLLIACIVESVWFPDLMVAAVAAFLAIFVAGKRWKESVFAAFLGSVLGAMATMFIVAIAQLNAESTHPNWLGLGARIGLLLGALSVHYYVRRDIDDEGIYRPKDEPSTPAQQTNNQLPWWLIIWLVFMILRFASK